MATQAQVRKQPHVIEVWHEGENGYWAALEPGWTCPSSGSHVCREDTVRELLQSVRAVRPCTCTHCTPAT